MAVEPQPPSVQNKKRGVFLLLVAGFVLAICLESARAPTHAFAWQGALFVRGIFGLAVSFAIAFPYLKSFQFFHTKLLIRSLLLTAYTIWMFYSVTIITAADVITITSTQPIWIAFLSMLFLKSRFSMMFWLAAVVVVVGMALLVDAKPPEVYGVIGLLVGFTILRAISIMMIRSLMDVPATVIAFHYAIVVSFFGISIFFIAGGHNHFDVLFDTKGTLLLLLVAGSASVYQALVAKVVQILGSISGAVAIMVAAVFSYFMGIASPDFVLDYSHVLGLLLILLPTAWIVFKCPRTSSTED